MSIDKALNEVSKAVNMFKGLREVEAALEGAKGWQNVEKETKARVDALKAEEKTLTAKRDKVLGDAEKLKEQAASVLLEAHATAKKALDEAQDKTQELLTKAQVKLANSEAAVQAAQVRLGEITAQAEAKEKDLATLEAKFNQLKSKIAALAE